MIPGGGSRLPATEATVQKTQIDRGVVRSPQHFIMKGRDVYEFVQRTLPITLERAAEGAGMHRGGGSR